MISVPELLTPLPGDSPCGEDLSYDADLKTFNLHLRGQPDTRTSDLEPSNAEPPNPKAALKDALKLFERTKDLRVTVGLALALLQTEALPGFAQGMELLRGLLEGFWPRLYPLLDPDDDNDPLERTNIIAALALPEGTYNDSLRFISRLKQAPLCRSKKGASFSLEQIDAATMAAAKGESDGTGTAAAKLGVIKAAFQDTPAAFLQEQIRAVDAAVASLHAVDAFLAKAIGRAWAVSFTLPLEVLDSIRRRITGFTSQTGPAGGEGEPAVKETGEMEATLAAATADAPDAAFRETASPRAICSRQDVIHALDAICAYYTANEPSSPLPELLLKAKSLVGRSFLEILQTLAPDTTPHVKLEAPPPPKEES